MRASVQLLPWSIDPSLLLASIDTTCIPYNENVCYIRGTAEVGDDRIHENNVPSALEVLNRNLTHVGSRSYSSLLR
jgi:hypothetical protein